MLVSSSDRPIVAVSSNYTDFIGRVSSTALQAYILGCYYAQIIGQIVASAPTFVQKLPR